MKKSLIFTAITLLLVAGLAMLEASKFNDGKLHVIFCDVGQGDAIFIRTPSGKHILIDGGPDRSVLNCLAKHMPFWERRIDLMLLTHPHADHFTGMYYVLERYNVTGFATEKLENKSGSFQELMKLLSQHEVPIQYVYESDKWTLKGDTGDVVLSILGPSKEFLQKTSPNGQIGEGKEFASLIARLSNGSFHVLFTGDTQAGELGYVTDAFGLKDERTDVLQSPHHGSRTGLNQAVVQEIAPKLAAISVGAHNRYGHPNKQTLDIFQAEHIPVLRTDKVGDIEMVSDGKGFELAK